MIKIGIYLLSLLTFPLLLTATNIQSQCTNYYDETSLPTQCNISNQTCTFSTFTNSTLIVNQTISNQTYLLCLNFQNYNVYIGPGTQSIDISLNILANSISINGGYTLLTEGQIILTSTTSTIISNATITSQLLWIQSNEVQLLNSTIKNEQYFTTNCDCLSKGITCNIQPYYFPFLFGSIKFSSTFSMTYFNYTYQTWNFLGQNVNSIVILSNNTISILNSIIRISVIAIYAAQLTINGSTLNTSGLGYPSGTGYGCGYFDEILNQLLGCTGTGGSHGGYGGNSGPDNCNLLMSNPPYERSVNPQYPGSGGGFFLKQITQVSSGGGVINIQTNSIAIQNTLIIANGFGGIQGGGGGAGGSISIDFAQYLMTPDQSKVSANGGSGKSSGGGGRMRIWNHNWRNPQLTPNNGTITFETRGGTDCQLTTLTCGQNGSITAAPCPPGYQLNSNNFACDLCSNGSYQIAFGYTKCTLCQNKPDNSFYNSINPQTSLSNYTQVCSFSCNKPDYFSYKGKQCLTSFEYVLVDVGGINFLICIGIIIGALIIFLIVMMIRKLSYSQKNIFEENQPVDYFKKKSYFKIQDIPYHEMRIYFEGDNTPQRPWKIGQKIKIKMSQLHEDDQKISHIFSKLIDELNEISQYSRSLTTILFILKIYYYPLSLFLASIIRQNKAHKIRNAIIAKFKNVETHIGVKLHVNTQFNVGCLQIFNTRKETLDFYIKNYFPLYFKLQKLILGGYSIDFTDPLLKALCSEFQDQHDKRLQNYLIQLNQLLRNCDQSIAIYKHLWKLNDQESLLQCYLWQPEYGVLGIDNKLQINKKLDLFLLFSTEAKFDCNIGSTSSLPQSNIYNVEMGRQYQDRHDRHFYYNCDLPNIYFDQISCIRHSYNLRQAIIDNDQKKTVFWEIDNSFGEKYLSWTLGSISILTLLLNLLSFFLIIFLMVENQNRTFIYGFIPYFALFPMCQFFMVLLQFSLIISKGSRILAYTIYFTLFCICKYLCLNVIIIFITISNGFNDSVLVILFYIWLSLLLFNVLSIILLCMLHVHYARAK